MLADQHANTDAAHVEAVEEGLDIVVDLHSLALALVLEDSLGDGCNDAVVPPLDLVQSAGEASVVVIELGWPFSPRVFCRAVITSYSLTFLISVSGAARFILRSILTFCDAGVAGRLAKHTAFAILFCWLQQAIAYFVRQTWS